MNKFLSLLAVGVALAAIGCETKEDPTKRPGFVDTSDPGKVMQTMQAPPKGKKDATSLGGAAPKKP